MEKVSVVQGTEVRKMGENLYQVGLVLCLFVMRIGIVECKNGVLLPFGTGEGDTFLRKANDYSHGVISLARPFTFLDTHFQNLYININGLISFKNSLPDFSTDTLPVPSTPFVAPYWGDVDTRDFGAISFRQISWEGSNNADLDRVNEIVRSSFVDQQDFSALLMLMVSWNKVGFNQQINSKLVNTFQCILVSDGQFSGVIFHYDTLLWTSDLYHGGSQFTGLGGIPAQIGFNAGDGIHAYTVHTSQTEEVINMTRLSNVNVPGRFVYRVDLPTIKDPSCAEQGDIYFYPSTSSMLGCNKIFIQGPCFDVATSNVVCKFEETLSDGTVESPLRAFCVSPTLFTAGDVAVHVSLDGGATFPYTGHLQVEIPITTPMVFKVNEDDWLSSVELELTWDTRVLEGVDSVNVVVYSYWEEPADGQMNWEVVETLAQGVAYSDGGLNFVKPEPRSVTEGVSHLMGAIGVLEEIAEEENRIPRAIWSDVDSLQWLYPQNATSWCAEWTNANAPLERSPEDTRPACPCVLRQAKKDLGRYRPMQGCRDDAWGKFPGNCEDRPGAFHCVVTRSSRIQDQECCYDRSGVLLEDRFNPSGFGLARYRHLSNSSALDYREEAPDVPYFSHFYQDTIPEMQCCKFSSSGESTGGSASGCSAFMARRPSQSCRWYDGSKPAAIFGASHISTFDGLEYTFPARGEYKLLQTREGDFIIQGRLEPIDTGDGATSSVLTAIAAKQINGDVIHIQTSPLLHVNVFVGRAETPFSLLDPVQSHRWSFTGVEVYYPDSPNQDSVELYFSDGVAILIKATGESLRCIVIVPPNFQNRTDGLLGSWNSNGEDDLRLDDGTILSQDSFGEDIVNSFGNKWMIQEDDQSLFYYLPGYSRNIYLSSEQPSITFDPEPEADPSTVCGDNTLCALDLAVSMNNQAFARATLDAQSEFQATREDLAEVDKSFLLCPELLAPLNGNINGSYGRYFGDSATFFCEDCYELIGNSTLSCSYILSWSGDVPVCVREANASCTPPELLLHGSLHVAACNRSVSFTCDEGFELIGQEGITCLNGSWSEDAPECRPRVETTIAMTTTITTTTTTTTTTAQTLNVTETERPAEVHEFTDHPKNACCSTPVPPVNGTMKMAPDNTTASFSCDQGFLLIGSAEVTCENGSWTEEAPLCEMHVVIDISISGEYRSDSGFILWWVFVLFIIIIVVALIIVIVFILCCGLKGSSEKSGCASSGQQYELVANT